MHPDFSLPAKPLVAGINGKIERPNTTFFYERPDKTVVMVQEGEAWRIYANRNQILGQVSVPYKQIGVSNGDIYFRAMQESQVIFKEKGLEAAQERLRKGLDEELEAARGHFQVPRNFDSVDKFGNPVSADGLPLPFNPRT